MSDKYSGYNPAIMSNKINTEENDNLALDRKISYSKSHLNDSPELLAITDKNHNILYANKAFLSKYKYSSDDIVNKNLTDIINAVDESNVFDNIIKFDSNGLWSGLIDTIRKDGSHVNIFLKIMPIFNGSCEILGYENIGTVISNEERRQGALFEELAVKLETHFRVFPDIFIQIDYEGVIHDFISGNIDEKLSQGINPGDRLEKIFPNDISKKLFGSIFKVIKQKSLITTEFVFPLANTKKIFEARLSPVKSDKIIIIIRDITKTNRIEKTLRKSESRFRAIWASSNDGMCLMNKMGKIIDVNQAYCELMEMEPDKMIGESYSVIYDNSQLESKEFSLKNIKQSFNRKNFRSSFEGEIKLHSGKTIFVEISSTIIESSSEIPLFDGESLLLTIFRDITERKQKEMEILKFKKAVDSTTDIVFLTDKNGTITYSNSAFTNLYGYKLDEVVGKVTPRILKSGLVKSKFYRELWSKLLNKQSIKSEFVNVTKSGSKISIEESIDPILDDNNKIAGFLAIHRDITERKLAEQALKNSELRFRSIWEKSYDGMRLSNSEGYIIAVNKAFCSLFEVNEKNVSGRLVVDTYKIDTNKREGRIESYKQHFKERNFITTRVSKSTLCNGKILDLVVSYSFIELSEGELLLAIFRDITDYKKKEEELYNLEKLAAIGTMSAHLAHEIKNPLYSIKSNIEMLKTELVLPDDKKKNINLIESEIDKLHKLMKDVLQYSKHKSLIFVEVNVSDMVEQIRELLNLNLEKRSIKLINKIQDITIYGDYMNLRSVFLNLLENSIEAIEHEGEIELTASKQNNIQCCIYIKDNGCGIENLDKLFEPFFSSKSYGTGLGLPIVRKIMEMHNGKIKLITSKKGETIFELIFPLG